MKPFSILRDELRRRKPSEVVDHDESCSESVEDYSQPHAHKHVESNATGAAIEQSIPISALRALVEEWDRDATLAAEEMTEHGDGESLAYANCFLQLEKIIGGEK